MAVIEAYPSACKKSAFIDSLLEPFSNEIAGWARDSSFQDKFDALVCALVAYCYVTKPDLLAAPPAGLSRREGWIWVPKDALSG
jgi:predicted RNase H-like nuclease